jgi:hypothetical protein
LVSANPETMMSTHPAPLPHAARIEVADVHGSVIVTPQHHTTANHKFNLSSQQIDETAQNSVNYREVHDARRGEFTRAGRAAVSGYAPPDSVAAPARLVKLGRTGAAMPVADDRPRQGDRPDSAYVHTDAAPLTPETAATRAVIELFPFRFETMTEQGQRIISTLARCGFVVVRDRRRSGGA